MPIPEGIFLQCYRYTGNFEADPMLQIGIKDNSYAERSTLEVGNMFQVLLETHPLSESNEHHEKAKK